MSSPPIATQELVDRIEQRLAALNLSSRAASLKTSRGPDVIRNVQRAVQKGEPYNFRADTLQLIASALETTPEWLLSGSSMDETSNAAQQVRDLLNKDRLPGNPMEGIPRNFRPPPQFLGERDLPVFSAVEGGPGAMVVSTDPIEFVPRPWFLREVKEGYAVVVTGESMVPVYEPGDMVIVNPRLPAIRNKNAIFVSGEQHGEFKATVKRLERSTAREWHVRQWNPPEGGTQEITLPKAEWPKALRIVGKYEGG